MRNERKLELAAGIALARLGPISKIVTKSVSCNEYALSYMNYHGCRCSGLSQSTILFILFCLMVCSRLVTWCQEFKESTKKED